jgi:ribosome biogenesis GTPase
MERQFMEAAQIERRVRKRIKRNRKKKRVRRRDWLETYYEDPVSLEELPEVERIMPKGEMQRRHAVLQAALATLKAEAEPEEPELTEAPAGQSGVVLEIGSSQCRVQLNGRVLVCGLRGSLTAEDTGMTHVVAVGDRVIVSEGDGGHGIVESILPRRSVLARPHTYYNHLAHVIAANVDQVLIVASWRDPHFWPELLDRYLIAIERNKLEAIICVNKVDLAESVIECWADLRPYVDLDYTVLFTSALTGEGIDDLCQLLQDRTTVLTGLSGVGKSTLLTAVQPGLQLRVAAVNEASHQGRHTTSQSRMAALDVGGYVIDTPGIREFGLTGLERSKLASFYPEIAALAGSCRFANCVHIDEPNCAVKAAVGRQVSTMRYDSYTKILAQLPG